ncbi:N-acetylglucosamine-binding protein GbpA [Enterovibrio sp. ZSDZ35]|uniref:N-acetylglucosamine-binding protein GbpA n=1 Tax=Enterovibrio qingdaonensis TaxID=2899818 RepID=A0ABT5QI18_9GAMM|nr:N-acetylglucosamine-binding protein GbpA [Enterovibrio sp. ZSDZ35]MDD1780269.1 N-acetylglucosamine-binding protein GbpA [Enterovibrio sp. ZSDZ35]
MLKLRTTLLPVAAALFSAGAMSHGYVSAVEGGAAAGRAALCKYTNATGEKNTDCGQVQWEPQSVEGPEGFPELGPEDGKIASAGLIQFSPLDEQTASRWVKTPITAGQNDFEWTFTANHVTRTWKYYITNADWNPNQPLARSTFDLNPFCVIEGNMEKPPKRVLHTCDVPERDGYQVILAVWDVGDTAAAFYNVMDVQFDGDQPVLPNWSQAGQINPGMNLSQGDAVFTRVFDANGERPDMSVRVDIDSDKAGIANNWSYNLATKINATYDNIKSGQKSGDDKFTPVFGANPIFIKADSGFARVEVGYDIDTTVPEYKVTVDGLANEYQIENNTVTLDLAVSASGDVNVEMTVYNHAQDALAYEKLAIADGTTEAVEMALTNAKAGHHMLVTRVKDAEGNMVDQQMLDFFLIEKGEQCGTDPDAVNHPAWSAETTYTGGEKVNFNGLVYEAKYWIEGATPETSDAWKLLSNMPVAWTSGKAYNGGDQVIFEGHLYQANWWVNSSPASAPEAWSDKGAFTCE